MRTQMISILAAIAILGFLSMARAEDNPDATLKLSAGSVGRWHWIQLGRRYSHYKGRLTR